MDEREKFIKEKMFMGYKRGFRYKYNNYKSMKTLMYYLYNTLPDEGYVKDVYLTDEEIINGGKEFYDRYFTLHKIMNGVESNVTSIDVTKAKDIDEAIDMIDEKIQYVLPFDINLDRTNDKTLLCYVTSFVPKLSLSDDDYYIGRVFDSIYFSKIAGDFSIPFYVHEVAHTELDSETEDIKNIEVISIFLEKLCALHLDSTGDLLKRIEQWRYNILYIYINTWADFQDKEITEANRMELNADISAILKAQQLFDLYINFETDIERQEMIMYIQKIFDGEILIEDLLDKYNITFMKGIDMRLALRHT